MKIEPQQMTPQMEREYLAGTLPGFMCSNPNFGLLHLLEDALCEHLAIKTGKRIPQKQRGVVVWE